jgi:hypothetical protein
MKVVTGVIYLLMRPFLYILHFLDHTIDKEHERYEKAQVEEAKRLEEWFKKHGKKYGTMV